MDAQTEAGRVDLALCPSCKQPQATPFDGPGGRCISSFHWRTPPPEANAAQEGDGSEPLWCMHITGSDDVHPAPDWVAAANWSHTMNGLLTRSHDINWPRCFASPQPWPWSADAHAVGLDAAIAGMAAPVPPSEQATTRQALSALVTAVTYADPPKLFNGVLCHEARIPVEFVQTARATLAATPPPSSPVDAGPVVTAADTVTLPLAAIDEYREKWNAVAQDNNRLREILSEAKQWIAPPMGTPGGIDMVNRIDAALAGRS